MKLKKESNDCVFNTGTLWNKQSKNYSTKENQKEYHQRYLKFTSDVMATEKDFDIIRPLFNPIFFDDSENRILSPLSCMREFGTHWILEFDLPLVQKNAIKVSLNGNMITIEAKLKESYSETLFGKETKFEYFKKAMTLPQNIDSKKISAKFENGRLSITLPKLKKGQKIKIE